MTRYMYIVGFIRTCLLLSFSQTISFAVDPAMGSCKMSILKCSEDQCELVTTAVTYQNVTAVSWYLNGKEINTHGRTQNRYTGYVSGAPYPLANGVIAVKTTLRLQIQPFLPENYGTYSCAAITKNYNKLQCELDVMINNPNTKVDESDTQSTVTIRTSDVYIAVGVVSGFVLVIIVVLAVVFARRRNRNQRPSTSTKPSDTGQRRRYMNAEPSNHTYASISSDAVRYESLAGRRGTVDGYDVPLNVKEDYLQPARLTVPSQKSDDYRISDLSFDQDSAFSNESDVNLSSQQAKDNDMMDPHYSSHKPLRLNRATTDASRSQGLGNPSYSSGSFRNQNQVIVVNKTINKTSVIEIRRSPSATSNDGNQEYQNIKKTRRLT